MACNWKDSSKQMQEYHDNEWGIPTHDDQKLFEYLVLESLQAGLSWELIIRKREVIRKCFCNFDVEKIASFDTDDIERIMHTDDMIKSLRKVNAMISNAKAFIDVQKEFGNFNKYLWSYSNGKTICYKGHEQGINISKNDLSTLISNDLKKRGFKYVGPVIIYSYLQACGIINDHDKECICYQKIKNNYPCITMDEEDIYKIF